jgi:tRNA threonylcarbamoyladenosine modification (KEOPS) complex Cgi121 subunit
MKVIVTEQGPSKNIEILLNSAGKKQIKNVIPEKYWI